VAAPERLRTHELAVRECKACNRRLQLGLRLGQLDFVRAWIDDEEKIALMDDLAVLEMDFRERPAYLRAQLDAVDCGKLTKESKPRVDIALQRPAYRDGRHDGLWCCRLTVPVVRGAKVSEQQSQCCCRADQPRSRGRSAAPQLARSFDRSSFDSRVVDHLIHGTVRCFFG